MTTKKVLSFALAAIMAFSLLTISAFAATPPQSHETAQSGIVMPRGNFYDNTVSVASKGTFTSYQYESSSGVILQTYLMAGSDVTVTLYGSNSIGGQRTECDKQRITNSTQDYKLYGQDFRYYNFKIVNNASTPAQLPTTLFSF